MKTLKRLTVTIGLALMMIGVGAGFTGCNANLNKNGVYAGDTVLYNADKTITSSYRILHSFVSWEQTYRSVLPLEGTKAADVVRANAEKWIDSAISLREAYASKPNENTKTALENSITILQQALAEATKYMANPPASIKAVN